MVHYGKKDVAIMLNYANLNDVEFEYLCQDVMSKKLGVDLRRFAPGKDGGIDLADKTYEPKFIVQVKHYIKTDVSGLINSLKKEVEKVEKLNPTQYYICCSKELTAKNISEIYSMFSYYMESDKNIITLYEIDDFLIEDANIDILRKHYKLWISSTNILKDLNYNDIFIDCEFLLSTIHEDEKYFVQTSAYNKALKCLSNNKTLFLIGDPGVGKTVTSKMLILYYTTKGYRVRYTSDVADLASLKRSLLQDRNAKEVILLDDCFGQAYFEMKSTQGTELLSLIRFINSSKCKILILNSRVTIYQDASKKTPQLKYSFENNEFRVQIINMSAISELEKAKILYNHMYYRTKDEKYFQAIKIEKNYMNIIQHKNYNPRIIEFISNPNRYNDIPSNKFYQFVIHCLDDPRMVWDNEYEVRIKVVDRCLLMTLYSLSNTTVSYDLVKRCFNKRIQCIPEIDTTINQFEYSLARLQKSFIRIIDDKGYKKLSMVNPSVNDYLKSKLEDNPLEIENILESAATVNQYRRLLPVEQADAKIYSFFETGKIRELFFENEIEKGVYITWFIAFNSIKNISYSDEIYFYLKNIRDVNNYDNSNILNKLFNEDMFYYYGLNTFLLDFNILEEVLFKYELEELPIILTKCYYYFENEDGFIHMCEYVINHAIFSYCNNIDASSYDMNLEIYHGEVMDYVIEAVKNEILDMVDDKIIDIILQLPGVLRDGDYLKKFNKFIFGVSDLVYTYFQDDYDGESMYSYKHNKSSYINDIDLIFNR